MERQALIVAMRHSISEVLETMFFLPLDFSDAARPEDWWNPERGGEIIACKLNFSGPFSGYFVFLVPKELAVSLAASFLGRDEADVSHDHVVQTVKEAINIIAGTTFGKFDDQVVFDLGFPELSQIADIRKGLKDSEEYIFIAVETIENRLAFQLVFAT